MEIVVKFPEKHGPTSVLGLGDAGGYCPQHVSGIMFRLPGTLCVGPGGQCVLNFLGGSPVDYVLHIPSLCFPYPTAFNHSLFPYVHASESGTISFLLSVQSSDLSLITSDLV